MSFDDLRDLYQDVILDRSRNPHHMHAMDPFDSAARGDNPLCGDRIEVRVKFDAHGRLQDVAYEARGCAISLASADLMADAVRGRLPEEARQVAAAFELLARTGDAPAGDTAMDLLRPLSGVSDYPSRVKCATLPWSALVAAMAVPAARDDQGEHQ